MKNITFITSYTLTGQRDLFRLSRNLISCVSLALCLACATIEEILSRSFFFRKLKVSPFDNLEIHFFNNAFSDSVIGSVTFKDILKTFLLTSYISIANFWPIVKGFFKLFFITKYRCNQIWFMFHNLDNDCRPQLRFLLRGYPLLISYNSFY